MLFLPVHLVAGWLDCSSTVHSIVAGPTIRRLHAIGVTGWLAGQLYSHTLEGFSASVRSRATVATLTAFPIARFLSLRSQHCAILLKPPGLPKIAYRPHRSNQHYPSQPLELFPKPSWLVFRSSHPLQTSACTKQQGRDFLKKKKKTAKKKPPPKKQKTHTPEIKYTIHLEQCPPRDFSIRIVLRAPF